MSEKQYNRKEHPIPETFKDIDKWETNRRNFLRTALITGAATQIAWFISCSTQLEEANDYLTAQQSTILKSILMSIFPDDGNGPSADDINSFGYILWVFGNNYQKKEDQEYIIEGLNWADETAEEIYFTKFNNLDEEQRTALIHTFVELNWGKTWMSMMVTLVLESLLLDPIYGGNVNESGWNWLEHKVGMPRPTEDTRLEGYLNKYKPSIL